MTDSATYGESSLGIAVTRVTVLYTVGPVDINSVVYSLQ